MSGGKTIKISGPTSTLKSHTMKAVAQWRKELSEKEGTLLLRFRWWWCIICLSFSMFIVSPRPGPLLDAERSLLRWVTRRANFSARTGRGCSWSRRRSL